MFVLSVFHNEVLWYNRTNSRSQLYSSFETFRTANSKQHLWLVWLALFWLQQGNRRFWKQLKCTFVPHTLRHGDWWCSMQILALTMHRCCEDSAMLIKLKFDLSLLYGRCHCNILRLREMQSQKPWRTALFMSLFRRSVVDSKFNSDWNLRRNYYGRNYAWRHANSARWFSRTRLHHGACNTLKHCKRMSKENKTTYRHQFLR